MYVCVYIYIYYYYVMYVYVHVYIYTTISTIVKVVGFGRLGGVHEAREGQPVCHT